MRTKFSPLLIIAAIALPLLLTCTGQQNPFKPKDANITLSLENSSGKTDTNNIIDTVEKTIHVGMSSYLPNYIDSVRLIVVKGPEDTEKAISFNNVFSWSGTQFVDIAFHSIGDRTVTAIVYIQGGQEKSATATITIVGKPFQLAADPVSTSANENSSALFFVKVSGASGQSFTFQWFKDGDIIKNATADSLVVNPVQVASAGRYECVVKDQWGDSVTSAPALLTVVQNPAVNHRPVLAVTGTRNLTPGQTCRLYLSATDMDAGQTFAYALIKGPSGGTLTDTTYVWTPPSNYTGADTVVFAVTDNGTPAMSDTQQVVVTVTAQLLPPARVQGIKGASRNNGYFVFVWYKIGNADSYLIYRSPDKTSFTALSPVSDTAAGDSTHASNYYYYVVAKNSAGTSPSTSDTIYSGDINAKPQWRHNIISAGVREGSSLVLSLADSCTDPNGDAVSFSLMPGGPAQDTILGGTIYSYSPGYSDSGTYVAKIVGSDGRLFDTLTLNLHVINVNRPPVFDTDKPKTSYAISGGALLSFAVSATDPDGDQVTCTVKSSTLPRAMPALNAGIVTWQSVMSDSGLFTIVLSAKDGVDSTQINVSVAVGKVNAPPSVSIQGFTKGQKVYVRETDTLKFTVRVSDPDSATEKLTLRMSDRSPFACGTANPFDSTTGMFQFVPSYSCAAKDTFNIQNVQFIGSDNGNPPLSDTFSISIGVINKNRPPAIVPLRDTTITETQALSLKVSAADPDSNAVTLSASGVPAWAAFTPATGILAGTPAYGQAGKYTVKFKAADDGVPPLSDSATIVITVSPGPTKANFTVSAASGEIPLADSFTNTSTNATSYSWDFGDGTNSTVASPVHVYTAPGTYIVRLLATGASIDSMKKVVTVSRPAAPTNVSATAGVCWIRLTWTKGATSASDTIYYAEGDTVTEATGTKIGNAASPDTIKHLKIGVKYSLAVVSCNSKGGKSNFVYVKATTVAPGGMKLIPAAYKTYLMGEWGVAEPVHNVTFTHDFYMDSTEVTIQDFNAVMAAYSGFSPKTGLARLAVSGIDYFDAVLYCNARSKRDGLDTVYRYASMSGTPGAGCLIFGLSCDSLQKNGYHLPTEAQWEYAARGGTTTENYWTNLTDNNPDDYAWTTFNTGKVIQAVALLKPNNYGLYDVSGNVAEMCNEIYIDPYPSQDQTDPGVSAPSDSSLRVPERGMSVDNPPLSIAYRSGLGSFWIDDTPSSVFGFRVCFTLKY
ncbi:MAG TPA: SUMF1/EgtB/PvdO family nonheme iron enzyme [Chitinivibrionales bacterium]|nr:SUMF1/EgtB/PvdO family nonheme iron enzyme [Chitinivibrionales bacterium]